MTNNFNCTNCGFCCGPVPVTKNELTRIKREVKKMSLSEFYRIKSQKRDPFDCIFRDKEKNSCTIYKARPDICRMFGFYEDMQCLNNPDHATRSREEGHKRIEKKTKNDPVAKLSKKDGLLSFVLSDLLEKGHEKEEALKVLYYSYVMDDSAMEREYKKV